MYRESPQETSVFCVLQLENIEMQKSKVTNSLLLTESAFLHKGSKKKLEIPCHRELWGRKQKHERMGDKINTFSSYSCG